MNVTTNITVKADKAHVIFCMSTPNGPGVSLDTFSRPDWREGVLQLVAAHATITPKERAALRRWLVEAEEPGDTFTVTDEDGDDVAVVVLG